MTQALTRRKPGSTPAQPRTVRVAIYTRVSVAAGPSPEATSIEMQRESCEAHIASRRPDGWVCLPERFDDSGYSAASTDRPGFQRILAEVAARRIDAVAIYRLDRFSRSVGDFVRTMDLFESHGVALVSVSQAIDTRTSSGRLLREILMAVASFERETTAERTRDRMCSARRKGRWVGGALILGFDLVGKKLVPNAVEAETVREIFRLYLKLGSLLSVVSELRSRGIMTKSWTTKNGRVVTGRPFSKTLLHATLRNHAYVGEVDFRGEIFPAAHEAIVERAIWDAAQALLTKNGSGGSSESRNKYGSLLRGGLLRCAVCESGMHHHQSSRGSKVWRAYVCEKYVKVGASACPGSRVPVNRIESFIVDRIRVIGRDSNLVKETFRAARAEIAAKKPALEADVARLQQERRRLEAERTNLVAAVGQGGPGAKTLLARLAEGEDEMAKLGAREQGTRDELAALQGRVLDESDVHGALGQFDEVWSALFPRERERIVRLLIERVVFDGRTGDVEVRFHPTGIKELAAELGAAAKETP